jgi:hypothetical protein
MIEVAILQAKSNIYLGKNATFLEKELYFGRQTKDGMGYVIMSKEGYWIPVYSYKLTVNRFKHSDYFNRKATIYMKNRKRLNEFNSVIEYLTGYNFRKRWYSYYNDVELYK